MRVFGSEDFLVQVRLVAQQKQALARRVEAADGPDVFRKAEIRERAVRGAVGDARVKTFVGLSFYAPDADVKQYLATSDTPLFLIVSTNDVNADGGSLADGTREVYRLSKSKLTELLLYDDAGRGSDMLKVKPELSGMIVRWLSEKLAN